MNVGDGIRAAAFPLLAAFGLRVPMLVGAPVLVLAGVAAVPILRARTSFP